MYSPSGALEGLEISRHDEAKPVSPPAHSNHLWSFNVIAHEFDTEENAASGFESISADAKAFANGELQEGEQEIRCEELPNLGAQASLVRGDHLTENSEVWCEYITVQHEEFVFLVAAHGMVLVSTPESGGVDKTLPAEEIAIAIISDGEKSDEAEEYSEDGTSTGGLWGLMPSSDALLLTGLVPIGDSIIFQAPAP